MTVTQTQASGDQAAMAQTLYDSLMGLIEPELLTQVIPVLSDMYKDETVEQRKVRAERYEKAFALFDERMAHLLDAWKQEVNQFKEQVMVAVQEKEKQQTEGQLQNIERSIQES